MLYTTSDYGGGNREFRVIPTDDRKHDPRKAIEATYMGYTVGHWEGDTLVLDSISFVDTTWFGRGGLFHSANMHMVPSTDELAARLRAIKRGDLVDISGYLIEIKFADNGIWRSSLIRTDTGNGGCELVWVIGFKKLE